ncbi:MAG: transglycosylase domain-containing protein [Acidobacteriota bacterium]|nr:transglycosylase domain-containing protein [Acidobacteriota bacterium]
MLKRLYKHRRRIAVACLALIAVTALDLFLSLRGRIQLVSPKPTPLFEDRHGRFLSEGEDERLGFQPAQDIPDRLVQSFLAIEDHRFYRHGGVDFRGMARAILNNLKGRPRQGGSTLAMQVARMQRSGARSYRGKLHEMVTARLLVRRFGRQAILNHYLTIVPQGNRMHGVVYAARRYFQKPVQDLSLAECALLAALPKAPGRFNLYKAKGLKRAKARARLVLQLLHRRGKLDDEQKTLALQQLDMLTIPKREVRPGHSYHAVLKLHRQNPDTRKPIRTGLDLDMQDLVNKLADQTIAALRPLGAGNIAVIVAERETGEIRAYLGSAFYADETYAGSINYADTPRSSGSTLKPFIYAYGLERGLFDAASVLPDLPLNLTYEGGHYAARNYDDGYLGPMLYGQALANSRNIPAIKVLQTCGLEQSAARLRELGLLSDGRPTSFYGLGLAIGGAYVTLEELVTAYGVLANDGLAFQLRWLPAKGEAEPERRMSEDVVRQVTHFLSDPQLRLPSFSRGGPLENAFPAAVKTGTSQGYRDAWAVAYSRRYVAGVWIGHPDHLEMKKVSGKDAAKLVKEILTALQPEAGRGVGEEPFPLPRGYRAVKVCPLSGEAATPHCKSPALVWLSEDTELKSNTVHRLYAVDRKTGSAATPYTPAEHVTTVPGVVLPPRYAGWAARRGYDPPPAADARAIALDVRNPADGSRLILDPGIPAAYRTLALRAEVAPNVPEVVWYVDGKPFRRVGYPYEVRWPMEPGTHTFQVRFPNAAVTSKTVTVAIQP